MRSLRIMILSSLVLIMLVAGCAQPIPITETPLSTKTVRLTKTITSTLTPTVTLTNIPTIIPTLNAEQASAQMLELLANNSNCLLPCLWGITPGKTTNLEAQAILLPLSGISISTHLDNNSPDSIWLMYPEGDLKTSINLSYIFAKDGIINHITFKAGIFKEFRDRRPPVYDSKTFGERLRPYMLSGILSEFGKPTSVVIQSHGKQITGSGGFEILLLYPDQGMLVRYVTQMKAVGANVRGCPTNAEVELELYPSGNADTFVKSLTETTWAMFANLEPVDNPSWKSIDIATSLSIDQFYEIFRQPTDKCIETPVNLWPTPEP